MIIGLTGKKHSGKDTAFEIIKAVYPSAERRGFADKLKESAAALLDVNAEWFNIEKFSTNKLIYGNYRHEGFNDTKDISLTIREFLQRYGTEAHRNIFGEDFWLEQCLPTDKLSLLNYDAAQWNRELETYINPLIVVTDVRFNNEAEWILKLNGLIWEIRRPEIDDGDSHPSEVPISMQLIHHTLVNDGTLENFKKKVEDMLYVNYSRTKG